MRIVQAAKRDVPLPPGSMIFSGILCLWLVLLAASAPPRAVAQAVVAGQLLQGDPLHSGAVFTIAVTVSNNHATLGNYALRLVSAAALTLESAADGGAGFGRAPLASVDSEGFRFQAGNPFSTFRQGRLFTVTFRAPGGALAPYALTLQDGALHALLSTSFQPIEHVFDHAPLAFGGAPTATPSPTPAPPATATPTPFPYDGDGDGSIAGRDLLPLSRHWPDLLTRKRLLEFIDQVRQAAQP